VLGEIACGNIGETFAAKQLKGGRNNLIFAFGGRPRHVRFLFSSVKGLAELAL
jgi:hypothetical protein